MVMQAPGEYEVVRCDILSHTLDDIVNIPANVLEFSISENIQRPFLTAKMAINDDFAMYDQLRLNGTELLELTIQQPNVQQSPAPIPVTLRFNIIEVMGARKVSDDKEVLEINLVETTFVNQAASLISKAYKGRPDRIIQQILKDALGMEIDFSSSRYIPPVQEPMHICIPYLTAFQACQMVLERMSTDFGMPFFLYTCMNTGIIQLQSLEQMLKGNVWNDHIPYRFSQAYNQGSEHGSDPSIVFNVMDYHAIKNENTIDLMQRGCVGSDGVNIDVNAGTTLNYHLNIDNELRGLTESQIIPNGFDPVHHSNFRVKDKRISDLNNKQVTTIMTAKTMPGFNNLGESHTPAQFKNRHTTHAMKSLLIKSDMTIVVPGQMYLTGHNASIGRQIQYIHHSNNSRLKDIAGNVSAEDAEDKSRSGIYTILAAKHLFTAEEKHNVILECGKLGRPI